jgi:hypothetical protein
MADLAKAKARQLHASEEDVSINADLEVKSFFVQAVHDLVVPIDRQERGADGYDLVSAKSRACKTVTTTC